MRTDIQAYAEQLVLIQIRLDRDARADQVERARRNASRFASLLCGTAAVISIVDFALLLGLGQ
jgi:hypothetical protein